jgi:spermidine synthase
MLMLFAVTLFVSSALLFLLQPMFAKMVLPMLGGSPAVWNTCVVFFQAALLAGYAYVHIVTARLSLRAQVILHGALLLVAAVTFPIGLHAGWTPPTDHNPIPWLLQVLFVSVGLPFFVVSTTAPLLQKWFSGTGHPSASDPYFLYAASNAGSIVALLSYPVLVEPVLRLRDQSASWAIGYGVLAVLTTSCAVVAWRATQHAKVPQRTGAGAVPDGSNVAGRDGFRRELEAAPTLPWSRRLKWLALAAAPSSLMLGVTTYLSTDIAAVPLLWIVPLVLYLVSFIAAFGTTSARLIDAARRALPLIVLPLVLVLFAQSTQPALLIISLHLAGFFVVALVCHFELATSRPSTVYLTEFYLWIAVGGFAGGLFNTLLAPVIFNSVAEYPAALAVACMLGSRRFQSELASSGWRSGVIRVALVGTCAASIAILAPRFALTSQGLLASLGVPALLSFSLSRRPVYFGAAVGAIAGAAGLYTAGYGTVIHRERTFFGVYRVILDPDGRYRSLYHGTTLHGRQSLDPSRSMEPLTYYHRTGPIGQLLTAFADRHPTGRVGAVGLGTGSLAPYATAGQHWTFYEIDPAVVRISEDPRYFTYLPNAPAGTCIVLGDARLSLTAAAPHAYDLLILDAFSSDAIPVHLLTREALGVYRNALAPNGVIAFHISNRHLDLQPVLANLAQDEHMAALIRSDAVTEESHRGGNTSSVWLVMAQAREDLSTLLADSRWVPPRREAASALWTDDFSNIWTVFRGH